MPGLIHDASDLSLLLGRIRSARQIRERLQQLRTSKSHSFIINTTPKSGGSELASTDKEYIISKPNLMDLSLVVKTSHEMKITNFLCIQCCNQRKIHLGEMHVKIADAAVEGNHDDLLKMNMEKSHHIDLKIDASLDDLNLTRSVDDSFLDGIGELTSKEAEDLCFLGLLSPDVSSTWSPLKSSTFKLSGHGDHDPFQVDGHDETAQDKSHKSGKLTMTLPSSLREKYRGLQYFSKSIIVASSRQSIAPQLPAVAIPTDISEPCPPSQPTFSWKSCRDISPFQLPYHHYETFHNVISAPPHQSHNQAKHQVQAVNNQDPLQLIDRFPTFQRSSSTVITDLSSTHLTPTANPNIHFGGPLVGIPPPQYPSNSNSRNVGLGNNQGIS
jgi:hypothetical protein